MLNPALMYETNSIYFTDEFHNIVVRTDLYSRSL
jgi:hypothetical protein